MRRLIFAFLIFVFFVCLINFKIIVAQDSTGIATEFMVKVTGEIDRRQVPLNRLLKFTVQIEWTGDVSRYQISELEDPILNNFEVFSTSSADYRMNEGGIDRATKTFEFMLKPQALGMGYIEGVMTKYIDNQTGEGHHLVTNRLTVEVIESEPDPGSQSRFYKWIVLTVVLLALFGVVVFWQWNRIKNKKKTAETIEVVPLEEEFLTTLKETVIIGSPQLDIKEAFSLLSKIIRKYLMQKYEIAALEQTSDELVSSLANAGVDKNDVNNLSEILTVCDVAKFAGSDTDQNQLSRIFTLIESLFEKNLAASQTEDNQENKSDR